MKHSTHYTWRIGQLIVLGILIASPLAANPWGRGGDNDCRDHRPAPHGKHFGGEPGGDMGMHLIQMGKKLDLTDEQETQILELSQKYRAEFRDNRELCEAAHKKMAELRDSDTFDEAAIRAAMEEAYPAMVERAILHAKYRSELDSILTDDQKAKLKDFHDRMHKRIKNQKEGRGDGECHDGPEHRWHKPDVD